MPPDAQNRGTISALGGSEGRPGWPLPPGGKDIPGLRSRWIALLLFAGFAILFIVLNSQQYTAVDGALRSLDVYHHPHSWRLHGNNHMLYPFWIWLWTHIAGWIGVTPKNGFDFVRLCQAMNSVAAAASIAVLFTILHTIAGRGYALAGSFWFGLSTAVLLHATNSTEPMMGLLFTIAAVALLVVAFRGDRAVLLFLAGAGLSLALASYQSMALLLPAIALACISWPLDAAATRPSWRTVAFRLRTVGMGGALAGIVLYGAGYASLGIPPTRMIPTFFSVTGGTVYSGFRLSKVLNIPFGLLRNLYFAIPADYAGIR